MNLTFKMGELTVVVLELNFDQDFWWRCLGSIFIELSKELLSYLFCEPKRIQLVLSPPAIYFSGESEAYGFKKSGFPCFIISDKNIHSRLG